MTALVNVPKTYQQRCEINVYVQNKYLFHNIYVVTTLCNDTTSQQRCVNLVYDTTLPQLRCNVVVTLCVSWEMSDSEQCSNRLQLDIISLLVNFSYELGANNDHI